MGHDVVAVEPTDTMREGAAAPSVAEYRMAGRQLAVAASCGRGDRFDVVMMTAVWMHLDPSERVAAMPAVASLLAPGGVLILAAPRALPPGRRMFDVSAEETIALAAREGLACRQRRHRLGQAHQADVTWTRLVFRR